MATASRTTKAMILAAGEGTRLRPLTLETPKVLLPVDGVPLACHILTWLSRHGISQVAINLHHRGDRIKDILGNGSDLGVEIGYSEEQELLGTAGGVKRLAHWFEGTFAVVYGDVLTDMDLRAMAQFHVQVGAMATVAVQQVEDATGKGAVCIDGQDRICSFVEKPTVRPGPDCLFNTGIYLLEPEILQHIEFGCSDFGTDVFPKLLRHGVPVYGWRLRPWEYLIDIGTPQAYRQANLDMAEGEVNVAPSCVPR